MSSKYGEFCPFCGAQFLAAETWPRDCQQCGRTIYQNPKPVAVLAIPIQVAGERVRIVTVRRGIPPQIGKLALPGGYIEIGESWQAAAVREAFEEVGLKFNASDVTLVDTQSAPDGTVLIFGKVPPISPEPLAAFIPHHEVSELVTLSADFDPNEVAFSIHADVLSQLLG